MRKPLSRAAALMTLPADRAAVLPAVAEAKLGDRAPLQCGMRGQDVRVLQDYLTKAGYDTCVDGAFGRGTRGSVQAFEKASGLRPNGVMTAQEIAALRRRSRAAASACRGA